MGEGQTHSEDPQPGAPCRGCSKRHPLHCQRVGGRTQGVEETINNGDELTAADVIFTMKEWLNKDVGSSMLSLLSYRGGIQNVEKVNRNAGSSPMLMNDYLYIPDKFHSREETAWTYWTK